MQLAEMVQYRADVELQFADSTLASSATALGMISGVLRSAIEAHAEGSSSSSSRSSIGSSSSTTAVDSSNSSSKLIIPMHGVSKDEWMVVAGLCYPVSPPVEVRTWETAELVLRVGGQFDMPLAMAKASLFIVANTQQLQRTGPQSVWKWLRLADQYNMGNAVRAIVQWAVVADRFRCKDVSSMDGLSLAAVKQLVLALAPVSGSFACAGCTESYVYMTHSFGVVGGSSCSRCSRSKTG